MDAVLADFSGGSRRISGISVPRILQLRMCTGIHKFPERGPSQVIRGTEVSQGVQGQSSDRGSGDEVPQKLKQNMKLMNNF